MYGEVIFFPILSCGIELERNNTFFQATSFSNLFSYSFVKRLCYQPWYYRISYICNSSTRFLTAVLVFPKQHIPDITSRTRAGHEQDTSRTRARLKQDTSRTQVGHEQDTSRAQAGHEQETSRTQAGHEQDTSRTRAGHEQDTSRSQAGHKQETSRRQAGDVTVPS